MQNMNIRLSILLLTICTLNVYAGQTGNWDVDGASGRIEVRGILSESACRLDLQSTYQEVELETTGTASLRNVGDRGAAVPFNIILRDCLRNGNANRGEHGESTIWNIYQPSVSFTFLSPAVAAEPKIFAVSGVSGLGLILSDKDSVPLSPGGKAAPLLLEPGQNTLSFYITPVRTAGLLTPGAYRASLYFYMRYD